MITHARQWDCARWPNFSPSEFQCRGNGELWMDEEFLDVLQTLRRAYGKPLRITSGYRSPDHNARVSTTGLRGPHTTGQACDIGIARRDAWALLRIISETRAFTGIGVHQKGAGRFIHIDTLAAPDYPRPNLWTY